MTIDHKEMIALLRWPDGGSLQHADASEWVDRAKGFIGKLLDRDLARIEELDANARRITALEERQQELLQTIDRLTNETPYPDEIKGWQEQRAKMMTEIGSLRAALKDVRHSLLSWRTPGGPQNMDRLLVANILAGIEQALEWKP